jgi:hypothetical protein
MPVAEFSKPTGINEGLSVQPGGADSVVQKFFCNILVAFGG